MRGFVWALTVWGSVLLVAAYRQRAWKNHKWSTRQNMALVLALLGTQSVAAQSEAEEVLRNPLVIERILRGALAGAALLLVLPPLVRRARGLVEPGHVGLKSLILYLGVAVLSTLFSAAPLVTIAKAAELAAGLGAVVAIALGKQPADRLRDTIRMVVTLEASLLAVAIVGFFVLPASFAQLQTRPGFLFLSTMSSPYSHSNALSSMGALLAAYCLAEYFEAPRRRRVRWLGGVALGMIGTLLASGRQGVVAFLLSTAVVLWVHRRSLLLLALGPGVAALVVMNWDAIRESLLRGRPETLFTLTGRVIWWQAALSSWEVHPWTGYGYGAGGRFVALRSIGRGQTSNVHSGYVEALIGVGIIGVIPLLIGYLTAASWCVRSLRMRSETAIAVLIVPLTLATAVAQGFGGWLNHQFVLLCLLAAIADRSSIDRRLRRTTHPRVAIGV